MCNRRELRHYSFFGPEVQDGSPFSISYCLPLDAHRILGLGKVTFILLQPRECPIFEWGIVAYRIVGAVAPLGGRLVVVAGWKVYPTSRRRELPAYTDPICSCNEQTHLLMPLLFERPERGCRM